MPKMKSHRASAKRFRRTKSGLFKRGSAYKSHIMTKFTTKRVRRLRKIKYVSPANQKQIEKLLPYSD